MIYLYTAILEEAPTAIQEIAILNLFSIGTLFIVGGAVVGAIKSLNTSSESLNSNTSSDTDSQAQDNDKNKKASDGIDW